MKKKGKIMTFAIAGIMTVALGIGTASAFAASQQNAPADALQARQEALAQYIEPTTQEALLEMAKMVGIDTTDMTNEQITDALKAHKAQFEDTSGDLPLAELLDKAAALGIDVSGKEYPEINREVMLKSENPIEKNLGTPADKNAHEEGLKNREEALDNYVEPSEHEALVEMANEVGIDITGMTDNQIKDALKAAKTLN